MRGVRSDFGFSLDPDQNTSHLDMLLERECKHSAAFLEQPGSVVGLRIPRHVVEELINHRKHQVSRIPDSQQLQCMRSIVRICRGESGIPNPCHHYVADRNINTHASKNLVISIPMPIQSDLGQHFLVGEDLRGLRVQTVVLQHLQAGRKRGLASAAFKE